MTYSPDKRRRYQREYYRRNKDKVREYQRLYYHNNKKKITSDDNYSPYICPREVVRGTFHSVDFMRAPVEKSLRMLKQIINGERFFTI